MYRNRWNGWFIAASVFIVIGLLFQLSTNPMRALIPLTIFGLIFYLVKKPPKWLLRMVRPSAPPQAYYRSTPKTRPLTKNKAKIQKRRRHPNLRVIDGKKKDVDQKSPRRKTQ